MNAALVEPAARACRDRCGSPQIKVLRLMRLDPKMRR